MSSGLVPIATAAVLELNEELHRLNAQNMFSRAFFGLIVTLIWPHKALFSCRRRLCNSQVALQGPLECLMRILELAWQRRRQHFYCVFLITLYKLLLHKATTRKRGEEKKPFQYRSKSKARTRFIINIPSHAPVEVQRDEKKKKLNYFSLIFSSCVRPFSFTYSTGQARSSFINPSLFKVLSSVPAPHTTRKRDILSSHQHRKPTECAKSKRAENVLDDQFESFSDWVRCAAQLWVYSVLWS